MLKRLAYANTLGCAGLILLQVTLDGHTFPRSILLSLWLVSGVMIGMGRISLRILSLGRRYGQQAISVIRSGKPATRVVIVGTDVRILKALREDMSAKYKVIGFLDDRTDAHGLYVENARILGPTTLLHGLLEKHAVDEVIVALPETGSDQVRRCVLACRRKQVPVKVAPMLKDVLSRESEVKLQDFSVEDLLRRPSVEMDPATAGAYLHGKRVLVTGAGGSIGSELCRQIAAHNPKSLVLLGHGENSIHLISQELRSDFPHLKDKLHCIIASIANSFRINQVMARYRPEIVFHAAAHKHVPLMELNEQEAIHNNVVGTTNVALAAGRFGVERFVLISTDKAADPCSVMGATKWLCEESVRMSATKFSETKYITVRFGNVLGSRGSVIPIFHEQIKRGGPVTVTHPDMTRFFMTIPEAVLLVIRSGSAGESGELFLLDMGKPVKILDLAKDMITLCGLEPEVDIPINFSGIREGERLNEQLTSEVEMIEPAQWNGLSIVHRPEYFAPGEFVAAIEELERAARIGEPEEVRELLARLIPGFCEADEPRERLKAG